MCAVAVSTIATSQTACYLRSLALVMAAPTALVGRAAAALVATTALAAAVFTLVASAALTLGVAVFAVVPVAAAVVAIVTAVAAVATVTAMVLVLIAGATLMTTIMATVVSTVVTAIVVASIVVGSVRADVPEVLRLEEEHLFLNDDNIIEADVIPDRCAGLGSMATGPPPRGNVLREVASNDFLTVDDGGNELCRVSRAASYSGDYNA